MKHRWMLFLFAAFCVLGFFSEGLAVVEWNVGQSLTLEKAPLDVAVSHNGRWIFVLTDGGKVLIYSGNGMLKDSIVVGGNADGIEAGPRDDMFFLTSRIAGTVQEIRLDFIQDIDTTGSPFKGRADAPVVVCVFTDFQ